MRQDRIYRVQGSDSRDFYVLVDNEEPALRILLFEEEPSKYTSPEQAVAVIKLSTETTELKTYLVAQIWSGEALKKNNLSPPPNPLALFERDIDDDTN